MEEQEIRKKEISENKIERNHKLIDKLKRAYDYECQLCSNEQRMPIEKQDGTKYVEVHHIKKICLKNMMKKELWIGLIIS